MTYLKTCDESTHASVELPRDQIELVRAGVENPLTAERSTPATQRLAALGAMTAAIVHDFRNLLAVIDSGLNSAERSTEQPERARALIGAVRQGVKQGAELTSQLLAFAKQGKTDAYSSNLNDLLRNLELLLTCGVGPGIHISLDLAADLPELLLDTSQFNAAVLNLVLNARDAMRNGGKVEISTRRMIKSARSGSPARDVYIRVRVKDNGRGMPADEVSRIFDPFFTTKGDMGTGLGLPQVCAFMRLVSGQISVATEPEQGTTVDLLFPTIETVDRSAPEPQALH